MDLVCDIVVREEADVLFEDLFSVVFGIYAAIAHVYAVVKCWLL